MTSKLQMNSFAGLSGPLAFKNHVWAVGIHHSAAFASNQGDQLLNMPFLPCTGRKYRRHAELRSGTAGTNRGGRRTWRSVCCTRSLPSSCLVLLLVLHRVQVTPWLPEAGLEAGVTLAA